MPRCEYSCCVTLLPCNQFHWGSQGGGRATVLTGGWPPLRTASVDVQQVVRKRLPEQMCLKEATKCGQ